MDYSRETENETSETTRKNICHNSFIDLSKKNKLNTFMK